MAAAAADKNLLFGVLAVQLDFVSRDQLIAATGLWVLEKQRPLSEIFVEQGMISADESQLVDSVVQKHLQRHNNDPRQSLHSVDAFESVRQTLGNLDDADVRATLEFDDLGTIGAPDPYSTQQMGPGETTSGRQRYTILRMHQRGGLGQVSIALDEELNREIALKEILPAHADHEENRIRFVREAEITGALEHPGVVPVYSLGSFGDGRPYYAMRFIRGVNLRIAIEDFHNDQLSRSERELQFRNLMGRFVDACNAMEYAHSRGVIHRDIKPSNIMVGEYGETLVVDWGLAKSSGDEFASDVASEPPVYPSVRDSSTKTQVGRVVGTPPYMSPEQAAGRLDQLLPSSDIYCLGATLYHLVTGEAPFRGKEDEILGNVQMGRFARPRAIKPEVPRALEAICLKAMERMPKDRYESARQLADDIERFLADERVHAYAEPLPTRAWRWIRHHRALVISSAAALTVAVTALTIGVVLLGAANVRERKLRTEATASYREAVKQQERAEHNFGIARDAVRDYYVLVSEETLLKQRGMQPLRNALLRQALVYYQQFLDQREDDPALREELARAHFLAGRITESIESPDKAIPYYQQAIQRQLKLLDEEPQNETVASDYGTSLNALGRAFQKLQRLEEAREKYDQAVKQREKLASSDPENKDFARSLASSVMNIGILHLSRGEQEEAIPLFERAQTIRLAHAGSPETVGPKLQRDLGMGFYNLAIARLQLGNTTLAENNLLQAVEAFERLLELDRNDMANEHRVARCHRILGDVKASADQPEEAIAFYERAQLALEALFVRNPDVPVYLADLAGVYINLGQQLQLLQRGSEALAALDEASDLLRELVIEFEMVPRYRRDLGVALRAAGKLLSADGQFDESRRRLKESKTVLEQLVRQHPSEVAYAAELTQTFDALATVDSLEAEAAEAAAEAARAAEAEKAAAEAERASDAEEASP